MFFTSFLNKNNPLEIKEISEFLNKYGVKYDSPEKSVVIRDKGKIIATGSVDGSIIKYLFIDEGYKGHGLMVDIYNELLNYLLNKNILDYFIFTTPNNKDIFTSLGLKALAETEDVLLLEGGFGGYDQWVKNIKTKLNPDAKTRGAIVANLNPMTKGHKYLIEYASKRVDELVLFVVEEDKSYFSTEARYSIAKNELKDIDNIVVVLGGHYIISQATFPTYFLKEVDDSLDVYTELDATLFGSKIAKDLDISIRFVGEEPMDLLTHRYNQIMEKVFENYHIKLEIIPRKTMGDEIISATKVRGLLNSGDMDSALELVVNSTKDYLLDKEGDNL